MADGGGMMRFIDEGMGIRCDVGLNLCAKYIDTAY
jgi:hypothetical protein